MKIHVEDKHLNIVVDSLKLWIQHYEERGYGPEHAIIAASMILKFNETAATILDNADNEPESEEEKHPEFARGPNPGEKFVYGKGYVDTKK